MTQNSEFLVAAGMRNEGAFLVEWVTWYRMLGFDVLVATNDCTDHSPQLLNLLHDAGWLSHTTHSPDPGTPPKRTAHRAIRNHPLTAAHEWLLLCDVDELLVFHIGDGTVGGYLGDTSDNRFHGIGFHWKCFGTSGHETWKDALQHRTFTRAAETQHKANTSFKSLIRRPLEFAVFGAHSPQRYVGPGTWGEAGNVWLDGEGRKLGRYNPDGAAQRATAPDRVTHLGAQMNHYITRTPESYALKLGVPSASAGRDRYTDEFWDNYNRNEVQDLSALSYSDRFDPLYAQAMAIPGVARLHHLCCADYVVRLAEAAGADPAKDPRFERHMDLAASV